MARSAGGSVTKSHKPTSRARVALGISLLVVNVHVLWFSAWIVVNSGWTPLKRFDPSPFILLTRIVTLEALCGAMFVISLQHQWLRNGRQKPKQPDLLAQYEAEIVRKKVQAIADHLGIKETE